MIIEDIIDGNFFRSMADCETFEVIPNKDVVILYTPTETYKNAIDFINNNPQQKFKLITHNSDLPVNNCYVPSNLVKWYAQNLCFNHPKVEPIPIGLENQSWHPHKREVLKHLVLNRSSRHRIRKPLCQFNPGTFATERHPLFKMASNQEVFADTYSCLNGVDFSFYADNLIKYEFCLCPRGNGIDTHRLWESILLGCIPIIKRHKTHEFDLQLPIVFIENWREVTKKFVEQKSKETNLDLFNSPLITKKYWKNKILESR
jgi:hypothetical protein